MKDPLLLIVSHSGDVTADFLVSRLQEREVAFYRLDTNEFPQRLSVTFSLGTESLTQLTSRGHSIDLGRVTGIWWRRPVPPVLSVRAPAEFQDYLVNEAAAALGGVLRACKAVWVNHPDAIAAASFKPAQLSLARELGWAVPRSIVTSSQDDVSTFISSLGSAPIIKAIDHGYVEASDGRAFHIFTREVDEHDTSAADAVEVCPVFLQERVLIKKEYRVTVVGDHIFATTIDRRAGAPSVVDWRVLEEADLIYEATELPEAVAERCRILLRKLGLRFGAIDIIESIHGDFVFLELNPNGQWAWIEMHTSQRIRDALIDELLSQPGPPVRRPRRRVAGVVGRRMFIDPFRSEDSLYKAELLSGAQLSDAEVLSLHSRDDDSVRYACDQLERANTNVIESLEHVVRKTLGLLGSFSLIFAILTAPFGFLVRATFAELPRASIVGVKAAFCASLVLFLCSLLSCCRLIWRIEVFDDKPTFWISPQFQTERSLRIERLAELVERIRRNRARVVAKASRYQSAVCFFFLSVLLEVAAVALLVPAVDIKRSDSPPFTLTAAPLATPTQATPIGRTWTPSSAPGAFFPPSGTASGLATTDPLDRGALHE